MLRRPESGGEGLDQAVGGRGRREGRLSYPLVTLLAGFIIAMATFLTSYGFLDRDLTGIERARSLFQSAALVTLVIVTARGTWKTARSQPGPSQRPVVTASILTLLRTSPET